MKAKPAGSGGGHAVQDTIDMMDDLYDDDCYDIDAEDDEEEEETASVQNGTGGVGGTTAPAAAADDEL